MAVVSIIPARGGSKGVPRKNVRPFLGTPLLTHTVRQALEASGVDRVIVTSEDDEILETAAAAGAETLRRPDEMATDTAEVDPLLIWVVNELRSRGESVDLVVLLYPTAPLRTAEDIEKSVALVSDGGYDCALTLVEDHSYLWRVDDGVAGPTNYVPAKRGPRQLEGWNQWIENKAVYVMNADLLLATGCRIHGRVGHVPMDKLRSIDIDHPEDFAIAEAIARHLAETKSSC